jgi:tetratricopeptide (TPR) repeat protein
VPTEIWERVKRWFKRSRRSGLTPGRELSVPPRDERTATDVILGRRERVKQLFDAALDFEPGRRSAFLKEACADDPLLRQEVESRLSQYEDSTNFVQAPTIAAQEEVERTLPSSEARTGFKRGDSLGRYIVLDQLGRGGMGVVYSAYDPELDRRVAIKLLRPEGIGLNAEEGGARMLREAQALARLSHPNVIPVFDVGTLDGQVFITMEFIDGQTLKAWVAEAPRPWREVLSVFIQAGRGLAAAHTSGLVHRDFKPTNVLISKDGRVRVLDFGLARAAATKGRVLVGTEDSPTEMSPRSPALADSLTRADVLMGTPAYMAPEQLMQLPTDPRSDQFSFCAALYEALYAERPFAADSIEALMVEVTQGRVRQPPTASRVPTWLRRVLLTGLRPDPKERHPSMDALLEQLHRDTRVIRTPVLAAGAAALVVAAVIIGYRQAAYRQSQMCKGAAERLAGVWDGEKKRAVSAALLATRVPYAAVTAGAIQNLLDAYSAAWIEMQTDACRAARVRGEQSEATLDLRTECLRRRLEETKALTDLFAKADAQIVEKAVEATQKLPSIQECADVAGLNAPVKLPTSLSVRAEVDKQRITLAEVRALLKTGKYAEALKKAEPVAADSHRIEYKPLEADAAFSLGILQSATGNAKLGENSFHEAARTAEAGHYDELKARALIELVQVVGYKESRFEQAHQLALDAAATVERLENPPALVKDLEYVLGTLSLAEGKFPDATKHFKAALSICETELGSDSACSGRVLSSLASASREQGAYDESVLYGRKALQILEKTVGPDHPNVADAVTNIGNSLKHLGKLDEALQLHQRALAIREKAMPDSPSVAFALDNIAMVLRSQGHGHAALEHAQRALAIEEKSLGPEHPALAGTLTNLGNLAHVMGDAQAAVNYHRRALAIDEKALGPQNPKLATTLNNLGAALTGLRNYQAALEVHLRALEIREKMLKPDHPLVASTLGNIGVAFDGMKKPTKALEYHRRALAIDERALGLDHPTVARRLTEYGRSYVLAGKPLDAIPLLERALAIYKTNKSDPNLAKFIMARALWDSRRDREKALQLGREAYQAFNAAGGYRTQPYLDLEEWLLPKLKAQGLATSPEF